MCHLMPNDMCLQLIRPEHQPHGPINSLSFLVAASCEQDNVVISPICYYAHTNNQSWEQLLSFSMIKRLLDHFVEFRSKPRRKTAKITQADHLRRPKHGAIMSTALPMSSCFLGVAAAAQRRTTHQSTTTCVANKKLETDIGITATILHARVLRWQIYWQ